MGLVSALVQDLAWGAGVPHRPFSGGVEKPDCGFALGLIVWG